MLKHKITQEFYTWTRWGRVGEPTCVSSSAMLGPFGSIEECRPSFAKKFKDKTGNAWGLGAFKSKKGKYEPVELDLNTSAADISDAAPAADVEYMECSLDAKTKELVEQMFSKDMQNAALQAWSLDVKKMPLGCPSEQQIQHGVVVLNRIKRKLAGPQHSDSFEELSSAFYTAIPHSFGRLRPPVINTDEMLQSRFDMCDLLTDLLMTKETMTKIEKAQPKKTVVPNPIDQQYLSLNADLSVLDRSSAEFAMIEKYFNETKQDSSAQLLDVWIVKREGEAERFQTHAAIDNHRLLFHGVCILPKFVKRFRVAHCFMFVSSSRRPLTCIHVYFCIDEPLRCCSNCYQWTQDNAT
jgi:poly [ADP-ribose] polymerase 2/3/4